MDHDPFQSILGCWSKVPSSRNSIPIPARNKSHATDLLASDDGYQTGEVCMTRMVEQTPLQISPPLRILHHPGFQNPITFSLTSHRFISESQIISLTV